MKLNVGHTQSAYMILLGTVWLKHVHMQSGHIVIILLEGSCLCWSEWMFLMLQSATKDRENRLCAMAKVRNALQVIWLHEISTPQIHVAVLHEPVYQVGGKGIGQQSSNMVLNLVLKPHIYKVLYWSFWFSYYMQTLKFKVQVFQGC
jgi:hypothetical protein